MTIHSQHDSMEATTFHFIQNITVFLTCGAPVHLEKLQAIARSSLDFFNARGGCNTHGESCAESSTCWKWERCPKTSLAARFMGPIWGPSGADRTQMGPMLAPWTLRYGLEFMTVCNINKEHIRTVMLSSVDSISLFGSYPCFMTVFLH